MLFPLSLSHVDFRGIAQGLSVSAHKASPAYAAFEDSRESYGPDLPNIPDQGRVLSAGKPFDVQALNRIPKIRQVVMRGLTIRSPVAIDRPVVEVNRSIPRTFAAAPATSPRTVSDFAAQLVQQELSSIKPVDQRVIVSSTGTPIVIRRNVEVKSSVVDLPKPIMIASNTPAPSASNSPMENVSGFGAMLAKADVDAGDMHPVWLTGQVEMTGGLAFVGPETQVTVKRVFNGQVYEQGRIWITEGKFEIRVARPLGFLVAELSTQDGRILGRGEISLMELGALIEKSDRINDLRIALRPTMDGVALRAISGYSHDQQKMAVADARIEIQSYTDPQKVNEDGLVTEPTLSRDSSFVARALAKGDWPTIVVGQAREPQDIRLFSNNLVSALINLTLQDGTDKQEALHESIIWGRITQEGQTVAGAQVELAADAHPIYFNDMYMPDPGLTSTGRNGLFAFIHVQPGVQAVRARIGNKTYPAQVFPTEEKHVSYLELDVRDHAVSQFKVFDGLNMNKPVTASIRLVGSDETLSIGKDDFVEYAVAANPFMVEADGGAEYELSRVTVTGTPQVVHIPLVSRDWLNQIAQEKNVQPLAGRGTIVGYMDDHDYEVELTGYAPGENMQIVYFDADGKALDSKTGVGGGGFVVFNAPPGLQTVYVHPTQSRETFSEVVIAEPGYVQVLTH